MRLPSLSLSLLLCAGSLQAQVTLRVDHVPANTPTDAVLYVAGSFNNWNPKNAPHALTKNADGSYQVILPPSTGNFEYKFTRGTWETVETDAANKAVENRRYSAAAGKTVTHVISNWQDLAGGAPVKQHTLTPNVTVLTDSFAISQLNRKRRVWVYLPNDYATSNRRYPVLYLHDGQNVFDEFTGFSGEWGVDETLRQLQLAEQDAGCIVVAVDHGGDTRLDELSPWRNAKYGGGQGDAYLDFMVQSLKPHIDAKYRTLQNRQHTGIAGSSMGGLISLYAGLKYPRVFSKIGVFSPALWFAQDSIFAYVRRTKVRKPVQFYLVAGEQESVTMVPLMAAMRDSLRKAGVKTATISYHTVPDGKHAEWFWRREFPAAYQWLYQSNAPGGKNARAKQ
ncbi:alpha/beta hydrolase-fold protein [Hymenobacter sp. HDW8]|uniref:alpha/beta hydrolase-fold protein n=1 Tax=Hymenobacter sp. HDW8 TaxID=2714932 RepID=UPI00140B5EF8|nr:alpha/beta hydrolase-fold protein [Hymenobacter sp. HDW8]QIL77752.1 alpha/beta hydrolase [Hymenobacter sp. HDW8]